MLTSRLPHVKCRWFRVPADPKEAFDAETRERQIIEEIEKHECNLRELDRSVYVIRIANTFVIQYPKLQSPVLYIGEGNLIGLPKPRGGRSVGRLRGHKDNWLDNLADEQRDFRYAVWFCTPRIRAIKNAYKSVEAHLIARFIRDYGALPLYNRQKETEMHHFRYSERFYGVLRIGKGKRPRWALTPCRSHPSYQRYVKGI